MRLGVPAATVFLALAASPALALGGCGHPSREPSAAAMATTPPPAEGVPVQPVPLASRGTEDGAGDGGAGTSANGLANPGPTSNPCTHDDECITHRCNPAFHRCAFPCVSDRDCIAGNYCYTSVVAVCLPHATDAGSL